ncbi:MAG: glycerophosphodiester phosphodiesterase [Myxococcota bacterium]
MAGAFRVIAHRGASGYAPENTLPAFEKAAELGATEVELDVRFSSDLEIVVFHDDRLERKTNLHGRVRDHTAGSLRRADIGSWFDRRHPEADRRYAGTGIATLGELLDRFEAAFHYHVEIKSWDDLLPVRLLQELEGRALLDSVTISSFSMKPLEQVRDMEPDLPICFLLRDAEDALRSAEFRLELVDRPLAEVQHYWIESARAAGFDQVGVRAADLSVELVRFARSRGLETRAWGVGDDDAMEQVFRCGAVGMTIDWPDRGLARAAREP